MTESESYLSPMLEKLIEDASDDSIEMPSEIGRQRMLARSLMNIRRPTPINQDLLEAQDEYLRRRNAERGVTHIKDIYTAERTLWSPIPQANRMSVWQGDITTLDCDAIVNAANTKMLGCFQPQCACIDNCIHTFGGMQIRLECNEKMTKLRSEYGEDYEQPTSVPIITDAYNLPCKKIIHVAGPKVEGNVTEGMEEALFDCYTNSLDLCKENNIESVAFCCISTGIYGFPNQRAAEIAIAAVQDWLQRNPKSVRQVIFDVFLEKDKWIYESLLSGR